MRRRTACALFSLLVALNAPAHGEDGHQAWLRYARISAPQNYSNLPSHIILLGETPSDKAAAHELQQGLSSMLGRPFVLTARDRLSNREKQNAIIVSSVAILARVGSIDQPGHTVAGEQYRIQLFKDSGHTHVLIVGGTPQAELYAVFHLLEEVGAEQPIAADDLQSPSAPIRWTDEWDNFDGSIERGFAGPSIFFDGGHIRQDLTRAGEYARLLASVGLNGCNINNVNANLQTLSTEHLHEFARVAEVFRPWGIHLSLSVDLTSPQTVGNLTTFDPLDPTVIGWWKSKVDEIYSLIPDFGGFTVKADSEGRKGPSQYGRSPADAANVLARALAPHHGVVLYRGFVYNNHLDWNDLKADRARAGVDNFVRYDGSFEPNVIIQIKEGPIDFQTREPVSPLFAALPHTNMAIELQTSQEYTGQQRHMVWLPAMWKVVLDTDLRADGRTTPVSDIVTGKTFPLPDGHARPGGFISVTNVGMEPNWLHHPMAMANLYGFGRLAWNPAAKLEEIIDTWTRLTWGYDPQVISTIDDLQGNSWHVYESYTGPNGMGTLTDILGPHFGPAIESAERNGWGQWFRGEKNGIGMDRTVATGTGYASQYPPELARQYESLATTPDDLLLFFHHVPYDYKLHSGKTLIQSIYDTHYAGALAAAEYVPRWTALQAKIDPERYTQVLDLFTYQAGHAVVWRDAINSWFHRISGIDDAKGRVDHDPNRIEAETMTANGYEVVDINPWETASGGKAVICKIATGCTLITTFNKPAGRYDIAIQYFDLRTGVSRYTLLVNGKEVAAWAADNILPPALMRPVMDGQTSTRYTAHNIALATADKLELRGVPDLSIADNAPNRPQDSAALVPGGPQRPPLRPELAPVDYLEIGPNSLITPQ
jgi:alpha-glucuronidase